MIICGRKGDASKIVNSSRVPTLASEIGAVFADGGAHRVVEEEIVLLKTRVNR